ncbi:protein S100-A13-like [Pleurodeles waltl]
MAMQYTEEENCVTKLVQCFYENSTGDGDKETLTLDEFTKMLKNDFPNLLKEECADPAQLVKSIDTNSDNKVKFSEYWIVVGKIAKHIKRQEKKKH